MDSFVNQNITNETKPSVIKHDALKVIALTNSLKERLSKEKLHFLELNKIIEHNINIFLCATQFTMEER